MLNCKKLFFIFITMFIASFSAFVDSNGKNVPEVIILKLDGVIGPATYDYVERALETAHRHNADLVIIRMDTPGGLDLAMRSIIKSITTSEIPIATYIAPSGARAASAGTYILYASHIAAMAPGTNLGAATPVQLGGVPSPTDIGKNKDQEKPEKTGDDAMKQKAINDAAAYIRGLAQLRNRNHEWAEKAVREAASLSASEALKENVIDFIAIDIDDLLKQLNGYEVNIQGMKRSLHTDGSVTEIIKPDWRSDLLAVITNPNVAYILMLIGIYGLILEFYNPGSFVPGTIGAIALILALYAFQMLPINYAGVGLILLGIALMVGEAFEPSFGMLGIGGIVAFMFGSIILMDTDAPGFGINFTLIISFTVISLILLFYVISMALKVRQRPIVSGVEELLGKEAIVLNDFQRQGLVLIHGEKWRAVCDTELQKDQQVKVIDVNGITLKVAPLQSPKSIHGQMEEN